MEGVQWYREGDSRSVCPFLQRRILCIDLSARTLYPCNRLILSSLTLVPPRFLPGHSSLPSLDPAPPLFQSRFRFRYPRKTEKERFGTFASKVDELLDDVPLNATITSDEEYETLFFALSDVLEEAGKMDILCTTSVLMPSEKSGEQDRFGVIRVE